jgi:hypothetical protein
MTWHFDTQITARRTFCANRSATLVLMPDVRIAVVRGCAFAHLHAKSRQCPIVQETHLSNLLHVHVATMQLADNGTHCAALAWCTYAATVQARQTIE